MNTRDLIEAAVRNCAKREGYETTTGILQALLFMALDDPDSREYMIRRLQTMADQEAAA